MHLYKESEPDCRTDAVLMSSLEPALKKKSQEKFAEIKQTCFELKGWGFKLMRQ